MNKFLETLFQTLLTEGVRKGVDLWERKTYEDKYPEVRKQRLEMEKHMSQITFKAFIFSIILSIIIVSILSKLLNLYWPYDFLGIIFLFALNFICLTATLTCLMYKYITLQEKICFIVFPLLSGTVLSQLVTQLPFDLKNINYWVTCAGYLIYIIAYEYITESNKIE